MKVQLFSDIHNDWKALEKAIAVPADIYIAAGDLVSWSRGLDDCGKILEPMGEKLWVIPGNHESVEDIEGFCKKFGFQNFHERSFGMDGYHFAGLGYSNPTPFNTPGEYSEEVLAEKLSKFAGLSPLVLVCHAPPHDTELDQLQNGGHAGSTAVREFVDAHSPPYFFCGHIHEAAGRVMQLGSTKGWNLGKEGYLLEL